MNQHSGQARPHDYNDPDAGKYFEKIKDLVFADKFSEAEKLADEHFYGKPAAQQAYQPIGDLLLNFNLTGDSIKDYYRELDMETGIVKVTYTEGKCKNDPRGIYVISRPGNGNESFGK